MLTHCSLTALSQPAQDFDVWSTKAFHRKPLVVRGDGPMLLNRRWYSQFYTEHSRSEPDSHGLSW